MLSEIVNLNDRQFHLTHKNRYYVAAKCEKNETNYDV